MGRADLPCCAVALSGRLHGSRRIVRDAGSVCRYTSFLNPDSARALAKIRGRAHTKSLNADPVPPKRAAHVTLISSKDTLFLWRLRPEQFTYWICLFQAERILTDAHDAWWFTKVPA